MWCAIFIDNRILRLNVYITLSAGDWAFWSTSVSTTSTLLVSHHTAVVCCFDVTLPRYEVY